VTDSRNTRWFPPVFGVALIVATLATFWPVTRHSVVHYDDPMYVTENPHVTSGLTLEDLRWAMTTGYACNWHPVTWISHMLDVQLFGLRPGWHHFTSLLLHTTNALLLFVLLVRLTGAMRRSAFVAALFALHPLRVESVAWLAERKDVMSGFFFLFTLLAYAKYAREAKGYLKSEIRNPKSEVEMQAQPASAPARTADRQKRLVSLCWYGLALFCCALGLMSKPMLVTTPFVLLLLDYWPLARWAEQGRTRRPGLLLLEKAPFFLLVAISSYITLRVQDAAMVANPERLAFGLRLGNAALAYVAYLGQTIWPSGLAVFYPYPVDPWAAGAILAFALLLGLTAGAVVLARRAPYLPVGWLWYLGMLVPVIGLVQVGSQSRADRYTYLPSIGLFLLVTWGVAEAVIFVTRWARRQTQAGQDPMRSDARGVPAGDLTEHRELGGDNSALQNHRSVATLACSAAAMVVLAALAVTTHRQVGYWETSESLFTHAIRVTGENHIALTGLGIAELRRGDGVAALTHLTRALELARTRNAAGNIEYYVGAALQIQGKLLEALPYLTEAVVMPSLKPDRDWRLAVCLIAAGRLPEAEPLLEQALDARPGTPDFLIALGTLRDRQGRPEEAEKIFRDVVARDPNSPQARRALGDFLLLRNRPAEAEAEYAAASKLAQPDVALLRSMATALSRQGKTPEATRQLEQALKLDPADAWVNFDLAELLSQQRQTGQAVVCYERAIAADPKFVAALNNLAWLLATSPEDQIRDGPRAVELAENACQLTEGKAAFLLGTLAAAYAEAGRFTNAVATAEKARDRARAANQEAIAKRNEDLLELYRTGRPFREKP
jgi:protein O-mannosyl-transferase